jgi:CRISPR-associated protein Cas5d
MKRICTQTKGMKPMDYVSGGNSLAIYTYLTGAPDVINQQPGVEYQVRAHFEWNRHRPELEKDRNDGKHFQIAKRSLERGGRQDIFSRYARLPRLRGAMCLRIGRRSIRWRRRTPVRSYVP